jgi:hypothetical protein
MLVLHSWDNTCHLASSGSNARVISKALGSVTFDTVNIVLLRRRV